jgi:cytochrome-b5 reductase
VTIEESKRKARAEGQQDIGLVIFAFFGGFGATVLLLALTSEAQAPTRLLPNKYDLFGVLDCERKTSTLTSEDTVIESQDNNGEHALLTVQAPYYIAPPKLYKEHLEHAASGKPIWRILSLFVREPTLQIERPYTPLYADSLTGPRGAEPIQLLVKRYPDGEMGKYVHSLQRGQGVGLRGPEVTWQDTQAKHLVLLVGGTGITPAYQLITSILGHPERPFPPGVIPRISLVYAATKPSSLLLLPELKRLQEAYGDRLRVDLFVDEHDKSTSPSWTDVLLRRRHGVREGFKVKQGRLNDKDIGEVLRRHNADSRRILVSGPDGMIDSLAGPKKGKRQGDLGGMLLRAGCKEEEVYKL